MQQLSKDTRQQWLGVILGADSPGGPRPSRSRFKAQCSNASLLSQPQPALTPARCCSFLELSQLSKPHPWGVRELDKPLLKLPGMKPLKQCCQRCNNTALTQSIPPGLPSPAVHPSLAPASGQALAPRCAVLDTAGRAWCRLVFPWRHQEQQCCRCVEGRQPGFHIGAAR